MGLTETNGSTLMDGTEKTLFDVSALAHYATTIYLDPMTSGDTVTVRVYVKDPTAGTMKKIYTFSYTGSMDTSLFIPPVPTQEYKVTMQQTAGTNRTFNWSRYVI